MSYRLAIVCGLVIGLGGVAAEPVPDKISFNEHVRPILSDKCFYCHGPDKEHRKAKLRLDLEANAKADMGDYFPIVPGKPKESAIIQRIMTRKPDELMPPPESNKVISERERAILVKWIEQGAEYETHWAYAPIADPAPPKVAGASTAIDAFVRTKLRDTGLTPNAIADDATLIRRATLDLTGLPPTADEVQAYLADTAADKYERLIERLFKSPAYGEHMARYWLDAARYGDTHGLHLDNYREMWPWRDWVINAFNQNMPYDQFTTEQLAGDLIPDRSLDQLVATGFCRNNVTTSEGGSIDEEYYVRYAVDRASTFSTIYLGTTAGCAACHDHKFDPLSQKEFYELYAFFNNVAEQAMDKNAASVPPIAKVPMPGERQRLDEIDLKSAEIQEKLDARAASAEADFVAWLGHERERLSKPPTAATAGLVAHYPLDDAAAPPQAANGGVALAPEITPQSIVESPIGTGLNLTGQLDFTAKDVANFTGDRPFSFGAWIQLPASAKGAMVPFSRMDVNNHYRGWDLYITPSGQVGTHLLARYQGDKNTNGLRAFSKTPIAREVWNHVFVTYDGSKKLAGLKIYVNGVLQAERVSTIDTLTETTETAVPFRIGSRGGKPARDTFRGGIDDVRIYDRALDPTEIGDLHRLGSPLVLPQGLAAHFPLDALGEQAPLSENLANPAQAIASLVGAPVLAEGKFAAGVRFSGRDQLVTPDAGDYERDQGFSFGAWVKPDGNKGSQAVLSRMDVGNAYRGYDIFMSDHKIFVHILNKWPHDGVKVGTDLRLTPNEWNHVFVTYDGSSKAAGVKIYYDGKETPQTVQLDRLTESVRTTAPFRIGSRGPNSHYIGAIDEVRLYDRTLTADEVAALASQDPLQPLLLKPKSDLSDGQIATLRAHYLRHSDPIAKDLHERLSDLAAERGTLNKKQATTLVMQEMPKPRGAFVLNRGEYDQRRDPVLPDTPDFLPPLNPAGERATRLELAKWVTRPDNPLPARVTVNRFWQQLFGLGLVETADDFGSQGTMPTHPLLLDHLATTFIKSNWDVQALLKTIMLSDTYRQSSRTTPEQLKKDPRNQLLSRGPRFRLDAEVIRDQALALSGLLVDTIGGPSVKPYQPSGVWKAVGYSGSNTVQFKRDSGDKLYRRGIYTFWKRTAPPPALVTFDAPSRENCTVKRERTNTPLQALVLMNDEQFVEAARHFGARAYKAAADPRQRIDFLIREATAHQPDPADVDDLTAATEKWRAEFQTAPERAKSFIAIGESKPDADIPPHELAAYTLAASTILNLDQVITKE